MISKAAFLVLVVLFSMMAWPLNVSAQTQSQKCVSGLYPVSFDVWGRTQTVMVPWKACFVSWSLDAGQSSGVLVLTFEQDSGLTLKLFALTPVQFTNPEGAQALGNAAVAVPIQFPSGQPVAVTVDLGSSYTLSQLWGMLQSSSLNFVHVDGAANYCLSLWGLWTVHCGTFPFSQTVSKNDLLAFVQYMATTD
jgi:hypothetical protein